MAGAVAFVNVHHYSVLVALLRWAVAEPGGTWEVICFDVYSDYDTTIVHLSLSYLL
jgi:hypothetical protein